MQELGGNAVKERRVSELQYGGMSYTGERLAWECTPVDAAKSRVYNVVYVFSNSRWRDVYGLKAKQDKIQSIQRAIDERPAEARGSERGAELSE